VPVLFTLKMLSISNFLPTPGPVVGSAACYEGATGLRLEHLASKDASPPPRDAHGHAKMPSGG